MVMAAPSPYSFAAAAKIHQRSIFEVPDGFFDSCRLLPSPSYSPIPIQSPDDDDDDVIVVPDMCPGVHAGMQRWACSTCDAEFESLLEQRSHFSSDFHRLNVKLSFVGKRTIAEEDFDETKLDSLCKDFDVSSISGSEDEDENEAGSRNIKNSRLVGIIKNKLFVQLSSGEKVSLWKSLILNGSESIVFEDDKFSDTDDGSGNLPEKVVIEKLKELVDEPRDSTCLRVVLLAKGGHFAGCVFDGNSVIAHKTFHRYVVRAKAGTRQSAKDGGGRTIHSAGASLRRYNELALKKDIQDLLAAWKIYFAASSCVFLHAPNNNQLFFDGKKPHFNSPHHVVRNIPLVVGRPTLKEAQRIYKLLTQVYPEKEEEIMSSTAISDNKESFQPVSSITNGQSESSTDKEENMEDKASLDTSEIEGKVNTVQISHTESQSGNVCTSTPLHEAAKSGNIQEVMDLLEQGLDPCVKDEKGHTPYIVATEKEVRNAFRRFMASNLDKWDWHAANVPSPLTQEMEEAQAAKQAEKDAKRKAKAKELKKLRKAKEKEKKAQAAAEAAQSKTASSQPKLSKEEELKRAQDAEREKRAAAAERRIAAMAALKAEEGSGQKVIATSGPICSCCHASLSGLVPFHRFNYKYCSSTCMHMHKDVLEDG